MSGPAAPQADPSMIGGVSKAPFVLLPDPRFLFARRAERLDALAAGHPMAPYLRFLASLVRIQAELASGMAPLNPVTPAQMDQAREHGFPPIDRAGLIMSSGTHAVVMELCRAARVIEMPQSAAAALAQVRQSEADDLSRMLDGVLGESIPGDALAQHLFVAAGTQVIAARLATGLDRARLVPIGTGICPVCGGAPITSLVVGVHGSEGARYAACSLCGTLWNEVRIKCLACGSTKDIGYRDVADDNVAATVKAEVCDACRSWMKILYQNKNPSLEPVADDVGSLGLDMLLRDAGYRHAGFNPFMLGY